MISSARVLPLPGRIDNAAALPEFTRHAVLLARGG
jgi:hypothetical protein